MTLEKEKTALENAETAIPTDPARQLEDLKKHSKKMKKKILIAVGAILGGLVLLFCGLLIAERLMPSDEFVPPEFDYEFFEPYEGDIMENPQYLACDRKYYYCSDPSGFGLREEISPEMLSSFDERLVFLTLYLDTIIAGNTDLYNSLFNENYFKGREPQGDFNPQMLYDAEIRMEGKSTASNGEELTTYALYYKIYRNDGTFRRDIGSDMSRKQLITLRTAADGSVSIERLITVYDTVISTPTE